MIETRAVISGTILAIFFFPSVDDGATMRILQDVEAWRIYLSAIILVIAITLRTSSVNFLLKLGREIFGRDSKWIKDIQRYLFNQLSWIILLTWVYLILYLCKFTQYAGVEQAVLFIFGILLIWATFAARHVITNAVVRKNEWNRESQDDFGRIVMVKEGMLLCVYLVILIQILVIYLRDMEFTKPFILAFFLSLEVSLLLSSYTFMKNFLGGLSLVSIEAFHSGALCQMGKFIGFIEKISLGSTTICRYDGARVYIPNGVFVAKGLQSFNYQKYHQLNLRLRIQTKTSLGHIDAFIKELEIRLEPFSTMMNPRLSDDKINYEEDDMGSGDFDFPSPASNAENRRLLEEHSGNASSETEIKTLFRSLSDRILNSNTLSNVRQQWISWSKTFSANHWNDRENEHYSQKNEDDDSSYRGSFSALPVQISLTGMYQIRINCMIDATGMKEVSQLKSKIMLEIIQTAEEYHIRLGQIG